MEKPTVGQTPKLPAFMKSYSQKPAIVFIPIQMNPIHNHARFPSDPVQYNLSCHKSVF